MAKNDIEVCHHLGDSGKLKVIFAIQNHAFEALKIEKCLCLLILPVLHSTETPIFFWRKTCLTVIIKLEKIKHLSQLAIKFLDHIFNFDDWCSLFLLSVFLLQMDSGPCQMPYVAFFVYNNSFYRWIHLRCLTWCWTRVWYIFIFAQSRSSFQEVLFFKNLDHTCSTPSLKTSFVVEYLLVAASTDHCLSLSYHCFASGFVLLLKAH